LTAELKEELDVSLKVSRICLFRLLHNKGWQNWKINYGKCWMIN
jgi:hypothetical protein